MPDLAPHIVLTLGRSGSNTLVDILNQNPEILNFNEVLGSWMPIRRFKFLLAGFSNSDEAYVDHLLHDPKVARLANLVRSAGKMRKGQRADIKAFGGIRTVGFKEFSLNILKAGLADHLLAKEDLRVIGLVRRNSLDRFISNERLNSTREVALRDGNAAKQVQLDIDPATVVENLARFEQEQADLDAMLAQVPADRKYVLDYDELYADPEQTLGIAANLFDFLGVSQVQPKIRMKKIIQQPPSEAIATFAACRKAAAGTAFAHYFD